MGRTANREHFFSYFLLLTGFFLLLEISFFTQSNRAYLADFNVVSDSLVLPSSIVPGIVFFLFVQLLIHLTYCILTWAVTYSISQFYNLSSNQTLTLGIFIWSLGIFTLLLANQIFLPNSKFSELTAAVISNANFAKLLFEVLLSCCFFVILLTLYSWIKLINKFFILIFLSFLLMPFFFKSAQSRIGTAANTEKPNIILIGIDSLRPDFLSYFGHDQVTPSFDKFLSEAAVFSDSITPLARTFPSWTVVLSGQYPHESGVRTNLGSQDNLILNKTLPAILQANGYETVFATDETRFSNIDVAFGFKQIVTPPMGLNDFLIGTFNDFPMSNLLINTAIGRWLFPYSYANRPVYFSYDPESFLKLLEQTLLKVNSKPLFLAVHLCITHYPYLWKDLSEKDCSGVGCYQASIKAADLQFQHLLAFLKAAGFLDHAIVVLLSDHGEALELGGDRLTEKMAYLSEKPDKTLPQFYPIGLDKEDFNQSYGHGTDVLGLSQYHTVLAFKLYGLSKQFIGNLPQSVSLLDIKPTILNFLQMPALHCSGLALNAFIEGKASQLITRHIFIESDFTPEAIRTVYPQAHKALLQGIQFFQIDPISTKLTVKPSMESMIVKSKQYADFYGSWALALYPQNDQIRMPILVNLENGIWTNDLESQFAKNSPAKEMLYALKNFYGDEIGEIQN